MIVFTRLFVCSSVRLWLKRRKSKRVGHHILRVAVYTEDYMSWDVMGIGRLSPHGEGAFRMAPLSAVLLILRACRMLHLHVGMLTSASALTFGATLGRSFATRAKLRASAAV